MVRAYLRFSLMLSLLLLIGCADSDNPTSSVPTGSACLFVANRTTLSVVNLETSEIANDVFGVGNAPNDLLIMNDLQAVVNSLSNDLNFFRIAQDGSLTPDGVADVGVAQNNNPWAAVSDTPSAISGSRGSTPSTASIAA